MEVLLLTIFVSVVLAMGFVIFFVWQVRGGDSGDAERNSLMPLDDESRRGARKSSARGQISEKES